MAFEQRSLNDYIDVAQRIADFRKAYPEGTIQPWNPTEPWRLVQADGVDKDGQRIMQTFIVVVAAAYRYDGDDRPGVGMAWEVFPGRTPYTRGSELQNAETSAWGRAIIAVGASDSKRGIASREEVRNRQAERDDGLPVNKDGSLSRSQTTDAEKDAAGVMTDEAQAQHNRIERETLGVDSKGRRTGHGGLTAERSSEPVEDVWTDGPAGLAPEDDPEDRPGTATADQIKDIHTLYSTKYNIKNRDARLNTTRKFLGIDMLSSHTRLSYRQAGDLLLAMRHHDKAAAT